MDFGGVCSCTVWRWQASRICGGNFLFLEVSMQCTKKISMATMHNTYIIMIYIYISFTLNINKKNTRFLLHKNQQENYVVFDDALIIIISNEWISDDDVAVERHNQVQIVYYGKLNNFHIMHLSWNSKYRRYIISEKRIIWKCFRFW